MKQIVHKQIKSSACAIEYLADHPDVIPTIARWIFDEWSFLYPGKSVHVVESFLRERLHKKILPFALVAFKNGKPVGEVSLKEFELETRMDLTPWVASLYVVKRWRGKGIGTSLMKAVEEKAARLGIQKLYLFTADSGLASHFYAKAGWKIKERMRFRSFPIIIMEKKPG
jgi:GNAT superfamily N-acetyltransferase